MKQIWYCDHKHDGPYELHRYMQQFVTNDSAAIDHYTIQPSIDSTVLGEFNHTIEIKTFVDYQENSNGYVFIGLHGGWTLTKLKLIKEWFVKDPNRRRAWGDPSCKIVIDYAMEGFSEEAFPDINQWSLDNNLENRLIYVSGDLNTRENFRRWCSITGNRPAIFPAYYGFFAMHSSRQLTPQVQSSIRRRYMCLNRRPHYHRILTTVLLERKKLIDSGTVSMPLQFEEPDIGWAPDQWDLQRLWLELKDMMMGYIDGLDNNFQQLYKRLPLIADRSDFETNHALDFNDCLYTEHPINLVTETLFFTSSAFASEKIWKPMAASQIFLVISGPYYLKGLRKLGFKTFAPYINEEYDLELDPVDRALMVVNELKRLISMNESDFLKLLEQCAPILEHNQRLLFDQAQIKKTVARELVQTLESQRGSN